MHHVISSRVSVPAVSVSAPGSSLPSTPVPAEAIVTLPPMVPLPPRVGVPLEPFPPTVTAPLAAAELPLIRSVPPKTVVVPE